MVKSWTISLLRVAGLANLCYCAQRPASVPQSSVSARIGYTSNFTCGSHGLALTVCLWEKIGSGTTPPIISFNPANTVPGAQPPQPGYAYTGEGLQRGQCGLVINYVKEEDNGEWQCTLIGLDGNIFRGSVKVGIIRKPDSPQFQPPVLAKIVDTGDQYTQQQSQVDKITCYSANGQPSPTFMWYLDDKPISESEGLGLTNTTQNQNTVYTFQELHKPRFTWQDNGKKLRCIMKHDALMASDTNETALTINVEFPPRATRDSDKRGIQVYADLGTETILAINVSANPRPISVFWTIDGERIDEGQIRNGYEARPIREVEVGVWEARLRIKELEETDMNKRFQLTMKSTLGEAKFDLNVSTNGSGTSGDDGTSSEKERMDGGSTGGTTDEKPEKPRKLSSRLSALYENLMAKKKDKTAPIDEEAGKDKEKDKDNEGNVVPSDEKKPDDIVYAELDLTTGGENPVVRGGTDDKTEYAEIIGVVPPEPSPKKSPAGSGNPSPKK